MTSCRAIRLTYDETDLYELSPNPETALVTQKRCSIHRYLIKDPQATLILPNPVRRLNDPLVLHVDKTVGVIQMESI